MISKYTVLQIFILSLLNFGAYSQEGISSISFTSSSSDAYSYTTQGVENDCVSNTYDTFTDYDIEFSAEGGADKLLNTLTVNGMVYSFENAMDAVIIQKTAGASDFYNPFFERVSLVGTELLIGPSYESSSEDVLLSQGVNKGIDATFECTGWRRIDFINYDGFKVLDSENLTNVGFPIIERGGNDAFKIAAITALNEDGSPSCYSDLITVTEFDWGDALFTNFQNVNLVGSEGDTQIQPEAHYDGQDVKGVLLTFDDLGIGANIKTYGYSLFDDNIFTSNPDACNSDLIPIENLGTEAKSSLDLMAGGLVFSTSTSALPLTLSTFYTITKPCSTTLAWETRSEINFSHFEIESSQNGKQFFKTGTVQRNEETKKINSYSYHINDLENQHYFRLKIVDLNGNYTYSNIISSKITCEEKSLAIKLNQNPIRENKLEFEIFSNDNNFELYVLDAVGRNVKRIKAHFAQKNTYSVELDQCEPGLYYLALKHKNAIKVKKFIKL